MDPRIDLFPEEGAALGGRVASAYAFYDETEDPEVLEEQERRSREARREYEIQMHQEYVDFQNLLGDYRRTPAEGPVYFNWSGYPYEETPGDYIAPGKAYSMVSFPERFDDVPVMVHNLVEYLQQHFAVDVTHHTRDEDGFEWTKNLIEPPEIITVAPKNSGAEKVDIAVYDWKDWLTPVRIKPGFDDDRSYAEGIPDCGCDACDDSYDTVAEQIEDELFGIILAKENGAKPWERLHPVAEEDKLPEPPLD